MLIICLEKTTKLLVIISLIPKYLEINVLGFISVFLCMPWENFEDQGQIGMKTERREF